MVTPEQYLQAVKEYFTNETLQSEQRLGQYLVNQLKLRTDDPTDTQELFYTKDNGRANLIMCERFIQ